MNITYYPFEPFKVESSKVNIIDVGDSKMYFELCRGFSDHTDKVKISNDKLVSKSCSSECSWYGDLIFSVDLNKLFIHKLQQRIVELMSDDQKVMMSDQGRILVNKVVDASFMLDLPLNVELIPDLEKIIKFTGIHFQLDIANDPYSILQTLIQTHVELGNKKKIILTNVSHYLSKHQFNDLAQLVHELAATVVIIEFSESNRKEKFRNACYYHVDEDFIDWRKME